jgi:hypothetical protein
VRRRLAGGLQRIAATLNAVPFVTMCNLANLDAALRGGLMQIIKMHSFAVGGGPALDYADATAFLAGFETIIEKVRRRRLSRDLHGLERRGRHEVR